MVVLRADRRIKCVVLGDDHVGKTSLLMNYATNRFPTKHVPNLFDNYAGSIELLGKQYNLQMIDTLDKGESDESRRHSYHGTDAFVICFSVVKPDSFLSVQRRWIPEVRNQMGDTPFILVGTHADLREDDSVNQSLALQGKRPITSREATSICRRLGAACYIECSPVMKKRIRRVMNDALVSVFCPKDDIVNVPCVIL